MIDTSRAEHTVRAMNTGEDLERTRRRKGGTKGGSKEGRKEGQDRTGAEGHFGMKTGWKAGRGRWTGGMAEREQE